MDPNASSTSSDVSDGLNSLTGLITSAVDRFGCVHIAPEVGRDFRMCQIKMDVARLRLSRWAWVFTSSYTGSQAQAESQEPAQDADPVVRSKVLLKDILQLFEDSENASQKYTEDETDMSATWAHAQSQIRGRGYRRRAGSSNTEAEKTGVWVVSEREQFLKLFNGIVQKTDDLEALLPSDSVAGRLQACERKIRAIHSMSSVAIFRYGAKDQDKILLEAIEDWLKKRGVTETAEEGISYIGP